MGTRGPVPKEQRTRARATAAREPIVPDEQVRGYALTNRLLEGEDDEWHPFVVEWWEAFRRSPMAQRLVDDTQWLSLELAMPLMQQYITGGTRGSTLRIAELKSVFTAYHVTPADLLRSGLEVVKAAEDAEAGKKAAVDTSLEARRLRLVGEQKKPPAKKAAAKKRPAKKK